MEFWDDFGRIALAGGLAALIGMERELADKPAGLRTHTLVAAGAALLTILGQDSMQYFEQQAGSSQDLETDPTRVIQAIVIGISFLGAGTIIHGRDNSVEGLTTAASIFITTGIGIAVATGRTELAVAVAVSVLAVLVVFGLVDRLLTSLRSGHTPNSR